MCPHSRTKAEGAAQLLHGIYYGHDQRKRHRGETNTQWFGRLLLRCSLHSLSHLLAQTSHQVKSDNGRGKGMVILLQEEGARSYQQ
jgi:hypothetical protein